MFEPMFKLFGWTSTQIFTFNRFVEAVKNLFSGEIPFKRLGAGLLAVFELFTATVFKTPSTPRGEELNLDGYTLVVYDEFEGDSLNTDLWHNRGVGARRLGYNAASQVSVENGNLVITGEYLDENEGEYGEGWYTGAIALNEWYCKGYFEIKCICNKDKGFWSAFWLQAEHPYDSQSKGGVGGAEIDIFEAMDAEKKTEKRRNAVTQTIHCNGVDDNAEKIDSFSLGKFYGKDIYNQYNTYGLKWTDDEYIFYINGVETARTSFGLGVSQVLENLIVSLEIPDELPEEIANNKDYKTQMIVDYVKIYQIY